MNRLDTIFAILAFSGIATHIVGNVLDDKTYWIASDVYSSIVFGMLGCRLLQKRKIFEKKD